MVAVRENGKDDMIALMSVYEPNMYNSHELFLYELLKERKPYMNISHKELPTWEKHQEFVKSKPYKNWYMICPFGKTPPIGSIYVSNKGEVGLFISEKHQGLGYGADALEDVMIWNDDIEYIFANIAPTNSRSLAFFVNRGFKFQETLMKEGEIVQHTYRKVNPYYDAAH